VKLVYISELMNAISNGITGNLGEKNECNSCRELEGTF
jgi:hypothetical protein